MKFFYSALTAVLSLLIPAIHPAQTEGASFTLTGMGVSTPFARDYQAIGINPGNLDIESPYGNKVTLGLLETGASLYSSVLTKDEIRQNIFQEDIKEFSQEDQVQYAREFAGASNAMDVEISTVGISMQTSIGTFAFRMRERASLYYEFGPQVSELMWLGFTAPYFDSLVVSYDGNLDTIPNSNTLDQETLDHVVAAYTALSNAENMSDLIRGTKFRFSWVREFNLSYGKKLWSNDTWQLHAGLGLKLLIGQGLLVIDAPQEGNAEVFSALSPVFDIDYDDISEGNESALPESAGPLTPVGRGFGVDLGATLINKNSIYLSVALNDIGSMTWDGNVYELNDTKLTDFETGGLESVNFLEQIEQLNGSDALLTWKGSKTLTTKLPTTLRIGAGYDKFPRYRFGIDIVMPMNEEVGSLERPVIAIGGEYSPLKFVHLQAGYVTGGNYDNKIPVGIYFTLGETGGYEIGVASRDAVTFFTKKDPTLSAALGFLRFRF